MHALCAQIKESPAAFIRNMLDSMSMPELDALSTYYETGDKNGDRFAIGCMQKFIPLDTVMSELEGEIKRVSGLMSGLCEAWSGARGTSAIQRSCACQPQTDDQKHTRCPWVPA